MRQAEHSARVVGVVADVRQSGLDRPEPHGTMYVAHAQSPHTWGLLRSMTLTVRTDVEPMSMASEIRRDVESVDPSVPLYQVTTMEGAIAAATSTERFAMLFRVSSH